MGMIQEIADLGLEREDLSKALGASAHIGGARIPYEPKELAGLVTTIRNHSPQRYLAIEGMSDGGWKYISQAAAIPYVTPVNPRDGEKEIRRMLRQSEKALPYDLISIDPRGLPLTAEEIWKYLEGGRATVTEFGKGAPVDYGPRKIKPGTLIIFNFSDDACKTLYYKVRTMDNKRHQSQWAGMVRL